MKRAMNIAVLLVGLCAGSCVDNEITFFIEHAKMQPEGPTCTASPSDAMASTGLLDLSFGNPYTQFYLVRNQLMARENLSNLKAETNGIFIDGVETSVRLEPNEAIGGTETMNMEMYIDPESTDVLPAPAITANMIDELATQTGCLPLTEGNYPADSIAGGGAVDAAGGVVPRYAGLAYASVRFLGHTNGGLDVATQEFTFAIQLCCGCLVAWENCTSVCERRCKPPEGHKMCTLGTATGDSMFDCRTLYYNEAFEWQDESCVDEEDNQRPCNCTDDCAAN